MEDQKPQHQIDFMMGVMVLVVCIIADLLSLIPFVGDALDVIAAIVGVVSMIFGVSILNLLIQGLAMVDKFFPISQEFPAWTVGWIIIWIVDRVPGGQAVEKVGEEASNFEAGGELGEVGEVAGGTTEAAEGIEAAETSEGTARAAGGAEGAAASESAAGEAGEGSENTGGGKEDEEDPFKPREEKSPIDENLKEDLFQPQSNDDAPSVPQPYQDDQDEDDGLPAAA
jgi:hypothetical protein